MRGKPLVYLDNGATSLKPQSVIDAEVAYLRDNGATIHRGVYEFSERATTMYDDARVRIKRFVGCPEDGEVVFTKSATESSNIIARSWGAKFLRPGDRVVTTEIEHHANIIPWQEVARATGAELAFIPIGPRGEIDPGDVARTINDRTRIVAVTGMSNVTGAMPAVREIAQIAHAAGALVVVDGAQLVSHHPVNLAELDADFVIWSSHKMCGPTGVGFLYARKCLLEQMDPFLYGGDMIVKVTKDRATYAQAPEKFEPGTPNISGVIALTAAIDYLEAIGMDRIADLEDRLLARAEEALGEIPGVTLYVPDSVGRRGGILSFNVDGVHPHDVGSMLDSEGIAVRAGFHCAQPFMRHMGVGGTVRASFYLYNTAADVDALVAGVRRAKEFFQ
ncbi:MAG: SufS family cysteine desulfurase [Spirochaetaceae bacterium]|nr:MAG: SufS family cysteine desulfurase [Spirochaetaceae bacterium]